MPLVNKISHGDPNEAGKPRVMRVPSVSQTGKFRYVVQWREPTILILKGDRPWHG